MPQCHSAVTFVSRSLLRRKVAETCLIPKYQILTTTMYVCIDIVSSIANADDIAPCLIVSKDQKYVGVVLRTIE